MKTEMHDAGKLTWTDVLVRLCWLTEPKLVGQDGSAFSTAGLTRLLLKYDRDERRSIEAAARFLEGGPRLSRVLSDLCPELLTRQHGHVELRRDGKYRRVARMVDLDILACLDTRWRALATDCFDWPALAEHHGGPSAGALRHGSVDTHIHLGAALPSLYYWAALMGGELPADSLRKVADDEDRFKSWRAATNASIRLRLEIALQVELLGSRTLGHAIFPWLRDPEWRSLLDEAGDSDSKLRSCALYFRSPEESQVTTFFDPLRLSKHPHYAAGERRLLYFARRVLLDSPRNESGLFEDLEDRLLQYIRYRATFHAHLSYDHGSDGLAPFVTTFNRRSMLKGGARGKRRRGSRLRRNRRLLLRLERDRMAKGLAAQVAEPFTAIPPDHGSGPLRRIEFRVEPPSGSLAPRQIRAWLDGIADYLAEYRPQGHGRIQVALVFHFIKAKRVNRRAENEAEIAARTLNEAKAIGHLLYDYPQLRDLIVGIDAAGDERLATPRAFEQAFHYLRHFERTERVGKGEPPINLGRTFHVGEDVEDFLTGLRHVDETAELLLRSHGGRLGHALILGENPGRFYERRSGASEPRVRSHLLDLIWAWSWEVASGGARSTWLLERIRRLARCTNEQIQRVAESMIQVRRGRDSPLDLESNLVANLVSPDSKALNPDSRIEIEADEHWIELMTSLQKLLRLKLLGRNLCIEANPTSNLLIGGYDSYAKLPYLPLVDEGLAVSLNTDDPGIFMTTLPGEFAALYEALLPQLGHRKALEWLAARVQDAEQSTFLHDRVPTGREWQTGFVDQLMRWRYAVPLMAGRKMNPDES